jgi:drug/metabolite transporter (DMT)-like permease
MRTTRNPFLGTVFALGSSLLFGLNASTSKVIMQTGVTPEQVVLFRSFASALLAGLVLLVTNRAAFRVAKSEWRSIVAFGIVGVALMQWAYSNAVNNLPIGIALLIEYTAIVIVPIASIWLFKERVLPRLWLGVVLVIAGLVVVSNIWEGGLNSTGILFAFAAATFLSIYFIMGERGQRSRDTMSLLFYSMLVATVFWLIASPWWTFDSSRLAQLFDLGGALAGITVPGWLLLCWLGVMGSFIPMLLSYAALRHLNATAAGVASTAETVFAFTFAWIWLREAVSPLQLVGGILVITGIVIAQTARSKNWQPSM